MTRSATAKTRRSDNKVKDLISKFSELSATSDTFDFPSYELTTSTSKEEKSQLSCSNNEEYYARAPELVQCNDSSAGSLSFVSTSSCTDVVDDESITTPSMSYFEVYKQSQEELDETFDTVQQDGNSNAVDVDDDEVSIRNIEELLMISDHSDRGGQWDDEAADDKDDESPSKRGSSTVRFADYADVYDIERLSESIADAIFYNDDEYSQFMLEAYDDAENEFLQQVL